MTKKVSIKHTLQAAGSMLLLCASAAIVYVLPKLIGSTWTDIIARIATIGLGTVMSIVGLWILGLDRLHDRHDVEHARAESPPGDGLNLAGSSASNLLPFGGVVGAGLNAAMIRSWRLSVRQFVSSTAVLNLVNLVTKLCCCRDRRHRAGFAACGQPLAGAHRLRQLGRGPQSSSSL